MFVSLDDLQGYRKCLCCEVHLQTEPIAIRNSPMQRRTRGHDIPKPLSFPGQDRLWVAECLGCNLDQKERTFVEWAIDLAADGDRRALNVACLAEMLNSMRADGIKRPTKTSVMRKDDRTGKWRLA